MTPDLRNQKQTIMRLRFQEACEAFQEGEYEAAAMRVSQIHQMVSAYMGVDSDLYWYGLRLTILWGEFLIQDETRDFNAWAVGQACRALKGLISCDQGPLDPELAAENIQLASEYLDERPQLRGRGVVVLCKGQVAGWMNELRSPEAWEPGCIAVDHCGNQYLAIGGDSYQGATAWNRVWTAKSEGAAA